MDLQISVFLLFVLFTTGESIDCYECASVTDSCADQKVRTCPESYSCFSSTSRTELGGVLNITKTKVKGCILSYGCLPGYTNFNSLNVSFVCCDTNLCNAKDVSEPAVNSNSLIPNAMQCYTCYGQNCSTTIMSCSGNEDHCITVTDNVGGLPFTTQGCASKAVCDTALSYRGRSICCSGNLCNGAKSETLNLLFLCFSLISFILML
ncbi:urokinase plasminogen activator surface receptor-like [Danio rerio]|uniref:Urokinase plasminogen activator surface receptor-like n=1 Tax=Danio rerio TaxID=7955 RepID=A0AB32TE35_DANRE